MSTQADAVMRVENLEVSYGGVRALRGVSMDLRAGQICALLGGNGAGKSTLMKCLTGVVQPDSGQVFIDERSVRFTHPSQALDAGVHVVYQELSLFPTLTVAENVLGRTGMQRWIRWGKVDRKARQALSAVGVEMDVSRAVGTLSMGEQQIVEIVRAIRSGGRVVILDEPTSALGREQAETLFGLMRSLADAGTAVVFVTQDFSDAQRHADVIRVMREGELSEAINPADTNTVDLIHRTFGADRDVLEATYEAGQVRLPKKSEGDPVLRVEDVESPPVVAGMSLTAHRGEVLGLFGSLDAGHLPLADAIFGARPRTSGRVYVDGNEVAPNSPVHAARAGIGYLPVDRREALALTKDVASNISLANLRNMARWWLPRAKEDSLASKMISNLWIKSAQPEVAVDSLSGGNQQKVLFARWLSVQPKVLVLVEPTRGMDLAAKSDVIRIIREQAAEGATIVVASAEAELVLSVSDRIMVAHKGEFVREFADEDVSVASLIGAS